MDGREDDWGYVRDDESRERRCRLWWREVLVTLSWELLVGYLVTLVALFSPLAAAAGYGQVVGHFGPPVRRAIALRLFLAVAGVLVVFVWFGEFLLEVFGVSADALAAAGGLALLYAGVPMMRGVEQIPPEDPTNSAKLHDRGDEARWQSLVATPLVFPLSIGGATVAASIAVVGKAESNLDVVALCAVVVVFAGIVGMTFLAGGAVPSRVGLTGRTVLGRLGGLLLTTIGLSVLVSSVTRLAVSAGLEVGA